MIRYIGAFLLVYDFNLSSKTLWKHFIEYFFSFTHMFFHSETPWGIGKTRQGETSRASELQGFDGCWKYDIKQTNCIWKQIIAGTGGGFHVSIWLLGFRQMSGDQLAIWQIYILITSGIWSCIMLSFLKKPSNVFTQLWSDREKEGGGGNGMIGLCSSQRQCTLSITLLGTMVFILLFSQSSQKLKYFLLHLVAVYAWLV